MKNEINYVYMSFRDPAANKNLGVCVVIANSLHDATEITHKKGINPGGEIMSWDLNEAQFAEEDLKLDRLYTREEMMNKGYKSYKKISEE